jgi:hypothetical protein
MILYHSTKGTKQSFITSIGNTAIKNLDAEKYQIVFECIDGYKPMMPLKILSVKSFLAVRDTDAPKVNYGQKSLKTGMK